MPTFYLDHANGDNRSDGLTPQTAWRTLEIANARRWQPGDALLLKRGGRWAGMLWPGGSGTSDNPITIGAYGDGPMPVIDGAGAQAALKLEAVDHWSVSGLRLENNAAERSVRCGVMIVGRIRGITTGIRVRHCEIAHVFGENRRALPFYRSMYWNGGVYVTMPGKSTPEDHLDDILIEHNHIHDVLPSGIRVNQGEDVQNDCCHTRIIVRGNRIERTGADGIIVANCDAPLIEYNRCYDAGALGNLAETRLIAGIWVCATRDALIQYNEVARTRLFENDGTAFDTDWGTAGTTTFRHNYSHDNEGGFWLDCTDFHYNPECKGTVLEGNVSVNDRRCLTQADRGIDTLFERNTFINTLDEPFVICAQAEGKAHIYRNNTMAFKRPPAEGWQSSRYEGNAYAEGAYNPADTGRAGAPANLLNIPEDLDGREALFGLSFDER